MADSRIDLDAWVQEADESVRITLSPACATFCRSAARKRGITLKRWVAEAIGKALVDEYEPQP